MSLKKKEIFLQEDNYEGFCSHHYNNSCKCKTKCCDDMDTHDEEFGPLIRKQIEADKKAKEKRDNTHAQGDGPSNLPTPPSLNFPIEILTRFLIDEEEYINYGIEQHPSSKAAFEESTRLAKERIPQLRRAIKILLHQNSIPNNSKVLPPK